MSIGDEQFMQGQSGRFSVTYSYVYGIQILTITARDMNFGVALRILFGRHACHIIGRIIAVNPCRFCQIHRFVVCDCGNRFILVDTNLIIPIDMDLHLIEDPTILIQSGYPIVGIDIHNILITKISFIPIGKEIIHSRDRIILDTVTGEQIDLHTIIIDVEMTAALQDRWLE